MEEKSQTCRACGQVSALSLVRQSTIEGVLGSGDFAITDLRYGTTAAIYRCDKCGMLQCPQLGEVLRFYEALEDPQYEEGRDERLLQSERIVSALLTAMGSSSGQGKSLLDVGAGSGILVEAATKAGFAASGIEPSGWLARQGQAKGIALVEGTLPDPRLSGPYDVVTLIDVIEHVEDPAALLESIRVLLKLGGKLVVVTPDVASIAASVLRYRWWHYRIAHVSYFNKATLKLLIQRMGFAAEKFSRPSWYFTYAYLRERLLRYLPSWIVPPAVGPLRRLVIPLNLGDSLMLVARRGE